MHYIHLLDGGLADNAGTTALVAELSQMFYKYSDTVRHSKPPDTSGVERIIIIAVNARVQSPSSLYDAPTAPGIFAMANSVVSTPIDSATGAHIDQVRSYVSDTLQSFRATAESNEESFREFGEEGSSIPVPYDIAFIHIGFDELDSSDPDEAALKVRLNRIPTSWTLSSEELRDIATSANILVRKNPDLGYIMKELRR